MFHSNGNQSNEWERLSMGCHNTLLYPWHIEQHFRKTPGQQSLQKQSIGGILQESCSEKLLNSQEKSVPKLNANLNFTPFI